MTNDECAHPGVRWVEGAPRPAPGALFLVGTPWTAYCAECGAEVVWRGGRWQDALGGRADGADSGG